MTGAWALLGAIAVVAVVAVVLRARDGRVRPAGAHAAEAHADLPAPVRALLDPGTPVTLVQLSTTFCANCRRTRTVLEELADRTEGLRHVELDVTDLPEVAATLGVLRAPTTLALAPSGAELLRVGGIPKPDALVAALRPHLPGPIG
ncbi:thioredoxin [Saccharothrix saharensis]|uniref:Thioredoxin n=1 Tax=Saccharothrix saharensis TaxID=571190 RepID=A0A543JHC5_9PSEU|nr:thioredoxin family protein [Saccharothrix saharensis]TQM82247.1 thioredoxin [Saccharothrix saharensis]